MSFSSHITKYGKDIKMNELQLKAIMQLNLTMLSERIQNPVPPPNHYPTSGEFM